MLDLLMLVAASQSGPLIIVTPEPPAGPTAAELRTLSQPHPNARPEGTFPDLAVKDMRIDGDTLYVLLANQGGSRASGPIKVTARAEANGSGSEAAPARVGSLAAGDSRWVPLRDFSMQSAAIGESAPLVALADASHVSVSISQPPAMPSALDRTGQLRDRPERDVNQANDSLTLAGEAIRRGRP